MSWEPAKLRLRPGRLLLSWATAAAAIYLAAAIVPGFGLEQSGAAFVVAAAIALLNAVVPPALAALRLPFMLLTGFLLVLAADALLLQLAADVLPDDVQVGSFGDALLAALVMSAASVVIETLLGTNDDDAYNLRVTRRIARRQGASAPTDVPGIVFLEIDGLALPVLRDAMRDGSAPEHGELDRRGRLPAGRVGAGPLLADRRKPGGDPARLERGHARVPMGREGGRAV